MGSSPCEREIEFCAFHVAGERPDSPERDSRVIESQILRRIL